MPHVQIRKAIVADGAASAAVFSFHGGAAYLNRSVKLGVVVAPFAGQVSAATENEIPVVDPFFMLAGALLKDSCDGTQLDATLWSRPSWLVENHKTIGVKLENGHLVISGPSHPEKQHHQHAGVISKYFRAPDVVQAQTPFAGKGRIQHMVHLCSGDYPDFFTEIIFGKIAAVEPPRWHTAYLGKVWALDLRHKRVKK